MSSNTQSNVQENYFGKAVIVIPSLNPDGRIEQLVEILKNSGSYEILIVNDGSAADRRIHFENLENKGCIVLHHDENKGKGTALKTAAAYIKKTWPDCAGYVTADADMQHAPEDIIHLCEMLQESPDALLLGCRDFSRENVPFRNRWGNRITSFVFHAASGASCSDTQTGLRGIPFGLIDTFLAVEGDRFEYEMNMLMTCAKNRIPMIEVPIETVYIDENKTSSFNVVRDSAKIYFSILKFSLASLMSAIADVTIFVIAYRWLGLSILLSTVLSRSISGCFNFIINKNWVFSHHENVVAAALRYGVLFFTLMASSWLLVSLLSSLSLPIILVKILVDGGLFLISYKVQQKYVFSSGNRYQNVVGE